MKQIVHKWSKIIQQFMSSCLSLPCFCELCLRPTLRNIALCQACEEKMPWLKTSCQRCAGISQSNECCFQCLNNPPSYERLTALFDYTWPASGFVGKLKYAGQLHFANMLGSLMVKKLTCHYPIDCIVAMPLHPERQRLRGFNQAIELAKQVSKHCQLPLNWQHCTKRTDTRAQATLSARLRRHNINARDFHISKTFCAKHVLVIEDVVTTGQTVNAFASALKNHGVSTVEIWAVCRTAL